MNDAAPAHLVEDLRFEVGFDHEDPALDQQARLASFVNGPALRIVDEVFDEADLPGEVLQFDHLSIDLGEVPAAEMEAEWALRLRRQLQDALAELRSAESALAAARPSPDAARRRSLRDTRRAALLTYLRLGRLPWHASRRSDALALARWAREWLDTEPDSLAAALRALGAERVARRLALQFPAGWSAQLLAHLSPGIDEAERTRRTATAEVREQWLLQALAGSGTGPVPTPTRAAPARGATPSPAPAQDPPAPDPCEPARLALLRVRLAAALTGGAGTPIPALWQALHEADGPGLRRLLERLAATPGAAPTAAAARRPFRALAQHLHPVQLHEALALWLPAAQAAEALAGLPIAPHEAPGPATEAAAALLQDLAAGKPWPHEPAPQAAAPAEVPPAPPSPTWLAEALAPAEAGAPVFIDTAGLVIAGPYLPRLLQVLELTDGPAFRDEAAAARAGLLLEYVATGETDTPEPLLALHKLLCGLPLEAPVARSFEPTPAERAAVEGMLNALIAHWKIIGKTSVAGLRSSFLQREGRLEHRGDRGWLLQVQARSFDMLLDQLPWSYTPLKFPWMAEVLHVEWR